MLEIIIALRIIGTALLGIKLIGINKNSIIKKCIGKTLVLDENLNPYIIKEHYIEMFKENIYATTGIIYIIISEICNLFLKGNQTYSNQGEIILYTIILAFVFYLIAIVIANILANQIKVKEKDKIKVDKALFDNGAVAVQIFEEDNK